MTRRRRNDRRRGFAVVLVIWAIGIISLLALSYVASARFRVRAAANIAGSVEAEALAEAGVNIAKLRLLAGGTTGLASTDGQPIRCVMPNDGVAAIAIDDEGGKVDLNAAPRPLLALLFRGFGAAPDEAARLAGAVADFASGTPDPVLADLQTRAYADADRPYGPKKALLETTLELDQVIGMPHNLFRRLLPYVTVHSRQPGIDPKRASLALLAALIGERPDVSAGSTREALDESVRQSLVERLPTGIASVSTGRSFLIHVEVLTPGQSIFVREAIVEFINGPKPLRLHEWRRGDRRHSLLPALNELSRDGAVTMPAC
jgi:general secretion pathway protein K